MGSWLRGKILYVFGSMIFSSLMVFMAAFSNNHREKIVEIVNILRRPSKSPTDDTVANFKEKMKSVGKSLQETTPSPNDLPVAGEIGKQVSASSNEYVVDEENYVLIQGKYYRARADNTYMVNGQKVYYVNNRREARLKKEAEIKAQLEKEQKEQKEQADRQSASTQLGQIPSNPLELMKAIKNIEAAKAQQKKALDDLDKQFAE